MDFISQYFKYLMLTPLHSLPSIIVYIFGIVWAVKLKRDYPLPSKCVIISSSILLLQHFIFPLTPPLYKIFGSSTQWDIFEKFFSFGISFLRATGILLYIIAVFKWRSPVSEANQQSLE